MIDVGRDYGYTDAKIRLAIQAAKAQGATLFFSAGAYTYSSTLTLDGIVAGGEAGAVLTATNKASMAVILKGVNTGLSGVKITCPTAELPTGPPTSARLSTGDSAAVFILPGTAGWTIDAVTVERAGSAGILNWGGHDGIIRNCLIRNTLADGIHNTNGAYNIDVASNRCENVGDDMFAVVSYERDGNPCHDITIHDNTGIGQPWGRGATVIGGYSIRIYNNHIESSYGAGMLIATEPAYDSLAVLDVEVSDNTIVNPDTNDMHNANILISGLRPGYVVDTVYGAYNATDPSKPGVRTEGETRNITVETGGGSPVAVQELQFPRVPAAAGTPWPEQTAPADFTTLDYEGRNNGSGTNERMSWVADPLGSSAIVWRVEVKKGDVADQFGDAPGRNRAEIWRDPHSSSGAKVGDRVFYAWSVLMRTVDFKPPTGCWGLSWQVHTPSPSATLSPILALDYDTGQPRFRGVGNIPGGFNLDHRQYFVVEVLHHTSAGEFRAWCSVDTPPDLTKPPTLQRVGYQTHPGDGDGIQWPKLGLYRAEGADSTYPWVAYYYGYGLALTPARAVELARFGAAAPPPPPPPPADTLPLTIISQTTTTVTVGWTPPAGAVGYRFRKEGGKWSHTWDGSRSQVKFGKPYAKLEVEALVVTAKGDLP